MTAGQMRFLGTSQSRRECAGCVECCVGFVLPNDTLLEVARTHPGLLRVLAAWGKMVLGYRAERLNAVGGAECILEE
jgi:hypothetical protein